MTPMDERCCGAVVEVRRAGAVVPSTLKSLTLCAGGRRCVSHTIGDSSEQQFEDHCPPISNHCATMAGGKYMYFRSTMKTSRVVRFNYFTV